MVQQYTTLTLLPRIAKCIDDIVYENYTTPVSNDEKYSAHKQGAEKPVDLYNNYDATALKLKVELTLDELQRLININSVFSQYLSTGSISAARLRSVLTAAQRDVFKQALVERTHKEEILYGDGMPTALKRYNMMLHKADMTFGRYGRMKIGSRSAVEMEDKAQGLYEKAHEALEEIFTATRGNDMNQLHAWMDRLVQFGFESTLSIDQVGMPRVRGSKNLCALDASLPKLSKRLKRIECALRALVEAAANIAFEFPAAFVDVEAEQMERDSLQTKLRQLKMSRE